MKTINSYAVIDLFAGPGGLGEGFGSLRHQKNPDQYAFRTAISIEKDPVAYRTLQLRHFYRAFPPERVPDDYYLYLEGAISLEELYGRQHTAAANAALSTWQCELGAELHDNVRHRINNALDGQEKWVLVGGPPCQAYSLAGRSRMKSNPDFEDDPRHFLYKEYLRILCAHRPPVFVMENVKGLISSKIQGRYVINDILRDLNNPSAAVSEGTSDLRYRLFSLSQPSLMNLDADPTAFVIRAEEYGVPQARHRIFILGIRSDIDILPKTLEKVATRTTVEDVIGDLPKIRSSVSRRADSMIVWLDTLTEVLRQQWFSSDEPDWLEDLKKGMETVLTDAKLQKFESSASSYMNLRPTNLKSWFLDDRLNVLLAHESRSHMDSDLHRYLFATVFARIRKVSPKLRDFPEALLPNHKNVQSGKIDSFEDRFRVQLPNAPATTITSHISKDGHYYIHYDSTQCRSLTVREAARIQTFPDNYKFEGNRTEQYHQVGNAVPPLLASKIAEVVFDILERMD